MRQRGLIRRTLVDVDRALIGERRYSEAVRRSAVLVAIDMIADTDVDITRKASTRMAITGGRACRQRSISTIDESVPNSIIRKPIILTRKTKANTGSDTVSASTDRGSCNMVSLRLQE